MPVVLSDYAPTKRSVFGLCVSLSASGHCDRIEEVAHSAEVIRFETENVTIVCAVARESDEDVQPFMTARWSFGENKRKIGKSNYCSKSFLLMCGLYVSKAYSTLHYR